MPSFVALHEDRLLVDDRLVLVQVLDEGDDAAFVLEPVVLPVALVVDRDEDAAVQKGQLTKALRQRVEAVFGGLEDLRVRLEGDLRATPLRRAGDLERAGRSAALVALLIDLAVPPDLQIETLGERVDHGHADAVQTAGDLVAVVVELAAGVKDGERDFGRGLPAAVEIDWNAAAVVDHGDRVVDVNRDVDLIAEAGQRFVDRVVDDFVDEMMQARRTGRADVHRRPLANGLESFEYLDLVGAVVVCRPVAVRSRRRRRLACPERVGLIGVLLFRMFHACP